jgi:hypothetical protein
MGLDMYLEKRTYVKQWKHNPEAEQYKVEVKKGGVTYPGIKPERVTYVIEEIGYWRKANAIHKWFVDNCQDGVDDCRDAWVGEESLNELLDLCEKVKADNSLAEELLPSAQGFFFGNTEYDEWYFNSIDNTIEILKEALEEKSGDYYYSSSW